MLASIDLSLRSAGVTVFDGSGQLHSSTIIAVPKIEADDEHLLLAIEQQVIGFLCQAAGVTKVAIEGLAFNGKSSRRDLIDGNWWNLKKEIRQWNRGLTIDVVPVTEWRKSVLSREEQREARKAHKTDPLKKACVAKLPAEIHQILEARRIELGQPPKSIYDLTDAYWLGQYVLQKGTA